MSTTYDVQFLFRAEVIQKYTTGGCRYFAERLAEETGGTVVGIGTDVYENYVNWEEDSEGETWRHVYTNPAHYLVKRDDKYIDITGVFGSLQDMLSHYNDFYKFALPDIAKDINMRIWTEPKKDDDGSCDLQLKKNSDETVGTLMRFIKLDTVANPMYKTRFVVPYNVNNDDFCRAAKIVFNATAYQCSGGMAFVQAGNVYMDVGGILNKAYEPTCRERLELTGSPDDVVWSAASIKRELLFGPNAFLDDWYHRPMFPLESVAYLYLPDIMLEQAKYPFKGAMLEAPFSDDVKDNIEQGDLYSAIGEYVDHSDYVSGTKVYAYDARSLTARFFELWFNVLSKEPLKTAFLSIRTTDYTFKYIQWCIIAFKSLPRLSYERDLTVFVTDPKHREGGYRQFRRSEYAVLEATMKDYSYTLTAIIGDRLNSFNIPGVAKTYVSDTGDKERDIFISPYCENTDMSDVDMKYFLFIMASFVRIIRDINRRCKFFYGYRVENMAVGDGKFYLIDFTESIYKDNSIDVSDQRENMLAKEIAAAYGIDILSLDSKHYVSLDTLCFFHASQSYYVDSKIKEYCVGEIQRLVRDLLVASR